MKYTVHDDSALVDTPSYVFTFQQLYMLYDMMMKGEIKRKNVTIEYKEDKVIIHIYSKTIAIQNITLEKLYYDLHTSKRYCEMFSLKPIIFEIEMEKQAYVSR